MSNYKLWCTVPYVTKSIRYTVTLELAKYKRKGDRNLCGHTLIKEITLEKIIIEEGWDKGYRITIPRGENC